MKRLEAFTTLYLLFIMGWLCALVGLAACQITVNQNGAGDRVTIDQMGTATLQGLPPGTIP